MRIIITSLLTLGLGLANPCLAYQLDSDGRPLPFTRIETYNVAPGVTKTHIRENNRLIKVCTTYVIREGVTATNC
jgi:hypothetical protein